MVAKLDQFHLQQFAKPKNLNSRVKIPKNFNLFIKKTINS